MILKTSFDSPFQLNKPEDNEKFYFHILFEISTTQVAPIRSSHRDILRPPGVESFYNSNIKAT